MHNMMGSGYSLVAGQTAYIEDNHSPEPLPATWEIVEHVVPRAKNLKAIVFECEYNQIEECLPVFERLNALFPAQLELKAAAR